MNPACLKIIENLHRQPMRYGELWHLGLKGVSNVFAYHLAKLKREYIVTKDGNDYYFLTFKGSQAYQLIQSMSLVANITINSCPKSGIIKEIKV